MALQHFVAGDKPLMRGRRTQGFVRIPCCMWEPWLGQEPLRKDSLLLCTSGGFGRGASRRLAIRTGPAPDIVYVVAAFLHLRALFTANTSIAMATLCNPLRRKSRAVDRSGMYPDTDRQEGSHGAAQAETTLALGLEPEWVTDKLKPPVGDLSQNGYGPSLRWKSMGSAG